MYNLDSKSVQAYVIGEHGDSETISWGTAIIGGKRVENVMKDNAERTGKRTKEDLKKETIEAGWQIFNRKGNTCYGIAASVTAIAKSVLFNENQIYPVTAGLDGQYGIKDAWISVPTIIDRSGAKEIVEINLRPEEEAALRESAEKLSAFYPELG